jgi:very-short-patch-repair endonuclease
MAIWNEEKQSYCCECGCGEVIDSWKSYVKGHYYKGKALPREYCDKISETLRSKAPFVSEESRQAMARTKTGVSFTQEHCNSISEGCRKAYRDNPSLSVLNSELRKKEFQSPERLALASKCHREAWDSSPEYREKLSRSMRLLWEDPIYCRKMALALNKKPNGVESELLSYLDEDFPGLFEYWGDGRKGSIAGKLPDFLSSSKKLIIEVFGSHWHELEEVESRTKLFADLGYSCYVLWVDGLMDVATGYYEVENWVRLKVASF